jgi:hypothetical protein
MKLPGRFLMSHPHYCACGRCKEDRRRKHGHRDGGSDPAADALVRRHTFAWQIFHDEKGKASMARSLLVYWTLQTSVLLWIPWVGAGALALAGSIQTALIAWAAGPRIAAYLGPQVAAVGSAVASAFRKDRDPALGIEPTDLAVPGTDPAADPAAPS